MSFAVIFNLLLTVLTLVTGACWIADLVWLRKKRGDAAPGAVFEFFRGLFPVIGTVFVVRSFLFEPFRIPSGSMLPTLYIGDFILVNKYSYGLRCPVGDCKLVAIGEPQRGDVVVFKWPKDPSNDFIKRVVGVPGDQIRYVDKQLTVNGEVMPVEPVGLYAEGGIIERRREVLSGVTHDILVKPDQIASHYGCPFVDGSADAFAFTVPEGQYFMMGDNRDGSNDSRCWGTVPEANLKGRAVLIWMSIDFARWKPDLSRVGTVIR